MASSLDPYDLQGNLMTDRYMKPEERLGLTPRPLPEQESSEAEESIPQKKQFISQDWDYGRRPDEPRPTPREDDEEESQQGESVVRCSGAAFGTAVVPPLLLCVFGWSVGWIRRGCQG